MIISGVCIAALLGLIGFIVFEFAMAVSGHPLEFVQSDLDLSEPEATLPPPPTLNEILARFSLLSPKDETRSVDGKFFVLCTWHSMPGCPGPPLSMQLLVDETPRAWDVQFGSNTWVAALDLPAGEHNIRCSGFEINLFSEKSSENSNPAAQNAWPVFPMHPEIEDTTRCFECHEKIEGPEDLVRRGRDWTLGAWQGNKTCFACHEVNDFETKHGHLLEPIEDCRLCHAIHGTSKMEPSLLKGSRKVLCARCHEAP